MSAVSRFLGSAPSLDGARVVLVGVPMDLTVACRPGCRFGPARIREVSEILEDYSPALDASLADARFFDAGDLDLPPGLPAEGVAAEGLQAEGVAACLDVIAAAAAEVAAGGRALGALGGEHLVTLGLARGLRRHYPDLAVLQLDAHADLRPTYLGQKLSHATVMRRIADELGPASLVQVGVRSGTAEEFAWARGAGTITGGGLGAAVAAAARRLAGRPVYVTIDIDVVDPSAAPATGSPEPGGPPAAEVLAALLPLAASRVVGFDIVEVAPPLDVADITSLLAAKLAREMLIIAGAGLRRGVAAGAAASREVMA